MKKCIARAAHIAQTGIVREEGKWHVTTVKASKMPASPRGISVHAASGDLLITDAKDNHLWVISGGTTVCSARQGESSLGAGPRWPVLKSPRRHPLSP
jgi:hypothetical protein